MALYDAEHEKELLEIGELMPKEEWLAGVHDLSWIDMDGTGHPVHMDESGKATIVDFDDYKPSDFSLNFPLSPPREWPKDATHMLWFNV